MNSLLFCFRQPLLVDQLPPAHALALGLGRRGRDWNILRLVRIRTWRHVAGHIAILGGTQVIAHDQTVGHWHPCGTFSTRPLVHRATCLEVDVVDPTHTTRNAWFVGRYVAGHHQGGGCNAQIHIDTLTRSRQIDVPTLGVVLAIVRRAGALERTRHTVPLAAVTSFSFDTLSVERNDEPEPKLAT